VEQINDAINNLDKQTQENAAVARIASTIAQKTSEIAKDILKDTSEKKFEEKSVLKNESATKKLNQQNESKIVEEEKPKKEHTPKNVEENKDEWETF
jgi:methyl-accepting chemotaxis protein